MDIALIVFTIVGLFFTFVLLYGAPYLPTLSRQAETALDLLDLKEGQRLLELGCGDGKMLRAAASRGIYVIGYELNPLLVVLCRIRTWRYRHLVEVHFGNFWAVEWPEADGVYVFLLERFMDRLDKRLEQYSARHRVMVASFAFKIKKKTTVDEADGVYLYVYGR